MTSPTDYQTAPVELPIRVTLDPVPVEGCDVCTALDKQRSRHRLMREGSGVTVCNVELRNHPHVERT
ncbi:hypothetical protein OG264_38870 (plasmid) [Streptomyces xanthophaeus]|uniref:hypothetical protein n=1 Tax=Streptomyces xanthophaeus TaxID=67385 RepID=UPI003869B45B|nr:hypothetical protein OG264_38870 [Streptomyces xanthophaeus]WST65859.1 hypothetical protein OG605_39865 [Streptomyces xanthophaeus]